MPFQVFIFLIFPTGLQFKNYYSIHLVYNSTHFLLQAMEFGLIDGVLETEY